MRVFLIFSAQGDSGAKHWTQDVVWKADKTVFWKQIYLFSELEDPFITQKHRSEKEVKEKGSQYR